MITITLDIGFIDFIAALMLVISASAGLYGIMESDLPDRNLQAAVLFVSTIYCALRVFNL